MFLLFLNTSPAVPAPATFTFQYVSIISRTGYYCFSIARKNLHSNMFLLFRWSFYLILLSNAIYIPICFYYFGLRPCSGHSLSHLHYNMFQLFLVAAIVIMIIVVHLHSNMFLLFPKHPNSDY